MAGFYGPTVALMLTSYSGQGGVRIGCICMRLTIPRPWTLGEAILERNRNGGETKRNSSIGTLSINDQSAKRAAERIQSP